MRLTGKVAVVTGAGSGFGQGMADRFAREGARVVVNDIDEVRARAVTQAIATGGGAAVAVAGDVSDRQQMQALVDAARTAYGHVDVFVNNAGVTHVNRPLDEVEEAEFDRIFAVNVKAIYLSALALLPLFRSAGGGCILNIASATAMRPRPGLVWYSASKGAVVAMTRAMAIELAGDGIRVNAVCPVAGDTPLLPKFLGSDSPEARAAMLASIPIGRLATPEDVASAAVYLASDEAGLVTGTTLDVDGGRSI